MRACSRSSIIVMAACDAQIVLTAKHDMDVPRRKLNCRNGFAKTACLIGITTLEAEPVLPD